MKKILIGCLVILVLGGVVLGVGAYFLYRAASPVIQNARDAYNRFSEIGEIDKQIKNQAAYTAPATGELTQAQVDRFARVQEFVKSSLGRRFDEIEQKYKHLKQNSDALEKGDKEPSFTELMSALSELARVFVDARRLQVEALNQQEFSPSEYSWVRSRFYQAAGVEVTSSFDFEKIAEAARKGTGITNIEVPKPNLPEVPARNRELVKPHMSKVDDWLPLAFFGL